MRRIKWEGLAAAACAALLACGGESVAGDDAGPSRVDAGSAPSTTDLRGAFNGGPLRLQNAVLVPEEPFPILCVSTEEIALPDCGINDALEQFLFVGLFYTDENGAGQWAFPDVTLREYGVDGPVEVEFADGGSMTLYEYDPLEGRIALEMELEFTSGPLSGTVSLP